MLFILVNINQPKGDLVCVDKELHISDYSTTFIDNRQHLKVVVKQSISNIKYGQCFETTGELTPISNTYYNLSSFNYKRYMLSKKIKYQLEVTDLQLKFSSHRLVDFLKNYRLSLIQNNIDRFPMTAPYLNALILGENNIDNYYKTLYGQVGIAAMFAISGFHINLLYRFLAMMLAKLRIRENISEYLCVGIIVIYGVLAGNGLGVNRALIMIICTKLLGYSPMKSLMITLIITLMYNPYNLLNSGYLLSYIITFIIIKTHKYLADSKIIAALQLATIIFVLTLPITYHFNYSFNLLQILVSPFLSAFLALVLIPLAFVVVFLKLAVINNILLLLIYGLNKWVQSINLFTVYSGHISSLLWIIYLGLICYLIKSRNPCRGTIFYCLWLVAISTDFTLYPTISIIDVGQGDSMLIELPNQKNYAIDFGTPKASQEIVKYYKYQGVKRVNSGLISHSHDDHYGGLPEISKEINFQQIYENPTDKVIVNSSEISKPVTSGNFTIFPVTISTGNNTGLVVKYTGNYSMLFTGDLESEGEKMLVDSYCNQLDSDVLKVGHHGSETSSTPSFLKCIDPSISVISSGRNNRYNHPDQEVVDRLGNTSTVYNTQTDGGIEIIFKPKKVVIKKSTN